MSLNDACRSNSTTLSELESLLAAISDKAYLNGATTHTCSVGTHVRHIIDFYLCFMRGVNNQTIDYDTRDRNNQFEIDRHLAIAEIIRCRQWLGQLTHSDRHNDLKLIARIDTSGQLLTTFTSAIRELLFLQSHSVHHMALIAVLLENAGHSIEKEIGVAISSQIYRQESEKELSSS